MRKKNIVMLGLSKCDKIFDKKVPPFDWLRITLSLYLFLYQPKNIIFTFTTDLDAIPPFG
jgi:hypothetical protein